MITNIVILSREFLKCEKYKTAQESKCFAVIIHLRYVVCIYIFIWNWEHLIWQLLYFKGFSIVHWFDSFHCGNFLCIIRNCWSYTMIVGYCKNIVIALTHFSNNICVYVLNKFVFYYVDEFAMSVLLIWKTIKNKKKAKSFYFMDDVSHKLFQHLHSLRKSRLHFSFINVNRAWKKKYWAKNWNAHFFFYRISNSTGLCIKCLYLTLQLSHKLFFDKWFSLQWLCTLKWSILFPD